MLEAIKFKLASHKLRPALRLPRFDPNKDLSKPEEIQLLPPPEQRVWGFPKLSRNEDIQFVLSNYGKNQTLWVELKWRPDLTMTNDRSESKLVTLQTKLLLRIGQNQDKPQKTFKFESIETYEPRVSSKRQGEIIEYGSSDSSFKLIYEQAFRRARMIFRGHMELIDDNNVKKFLSFSLIGCPTSRIFDMQTETNVECFQEQWRARPTGSTLELNDAIDSLVFEDRLVQTFRFTGSLKVEDEEDDVIYLWGFHSRVFQQQKTKPSGGDDDTKNAQQELIKRKRLMCHLTNGQIFQIVRSTTSLDDHQVQIEHGYTCFRIRLLKEPIAKPVQKLDWNQLSSETETFELALSGQDVDMDLKAKRKSNLGSMTIFDVDFNDTEGIAYYFEEVETPDQSIDAIFVEHLEKHKKLIEQKQVFVDAPLDADTKDLVLNLSDDEASLSSDLVGGKAASLAHLFRLAKTNESCGFKVPQALAISKFGYELFLQENGSLNDETKKLEEFLGAQEINDLESIRDRCNQLVSAFEQAKLPEKLRNELQSKLSALNLSDAELKNHPFAVRSSSWGEDTEDMSAAGQLTTKLNVRGLQKIEEAILQCFASKYSPENVHYKLQHGLTPNLPMSVVLQSMVQCHKAGVMFTCDPISGDKTVISISANFGLGESVVSGDADPDQIRVRVAHDDDDSKLQVLEAKSGKKSVVISEQAEVHNWNKDNCCMGHDEMLQIARCGRLVSRYFCASRDIEWGLHDNVLYLFQSRPITNLDLYSEHELIHEADRVSRAEDEWRTRVNLNEVFPYAISPFTLTYYVQSWTIMGARFNRQFTKHVDTTPEASADILSDTYYNFFSLRRSFVFGTTDPNGPNAHLGKSIEMGFFGHEVGPQPGIAKASKNVPPPEMIFQGYYFDLVTTPMRLAPVYTTCRLYSLVRQTEQLVRDEKKYKNQPDPLMALYNILMIVLKNHGKSLMTHFIVIFLGGFANQILHAILSRHIKDPRELYAALNKFLGAAKNVVSAEIPERLEKLANLIRERGVEETKRFAEMPNDQALEYLMDEKKEFSDNVGSQFKQFIDGFGHRCYNEWELRAKPWREDPTAVVDMLKKNCSIDKETVAKITRNKVATNDEIIESLGLKFTSKERWFVRNMFAPRCQAYVAAREFSKDVSIRYIDLERIVSRRLAKELHKKLRLPDTDLFYFLLLDELEPIIRSPQPGIVSQAIRRRQLFNRIFKDAWKFDEIIAGYHLVPHHLQAQQELDLDILNAPKIIGSPASSGSVRGPVRIIESYQQLSRIQAGDILVTYSTDIAFSPVFPLVSGIVTEVGGLISHGAVVAREYGLPSLLGVVNATKILQDGEEIILDANKGYIIRCSKEEASLAVAVEDNNSTKNDHH